jgi:predicted dienelactone hydrolase
MYLKFVAVLSAHLLIVSCADNQQKVAQAASTSQNALVTEQNGIKTQTLNLFDKARNRAVPVALYLPASGGNLAKGQGPKLKLAIINHGYGGTNTGYTFIAYNLVAQGYCVASIQHEIRGDAPMAMTNNIMQDRKPHWERGVQNMLFVLEELKNTNLNVDHNSLLIVGHSNGGDMAMLFAQQHPDLVQKIISLDNRRMPLPRSKKVQVLTLRSSDQVADDGVLPTPAEQQQFGTQIVQMTNLTHNDIWDGATDEKKQEVNAVINKFLKMK